MSNPKKTQGNNCQSCALQARIPWVCSSANVMFSSFSNSANSSRVVTRPLTFAKMKTNDFNRSNGEGERA